MVWSLNWRLFKTSLIGLAVLLIQPTLFPCLSHKSSAHAQMRDTLVSEVWETATLNGVRIGYTQRQTSRDKDGCLHSVETLSLTLQRFRSTVSVRMEQGTVENPDGAVLGVSMRQLHPGGRTLTLVGTRENPKAGMMRVLIDSKLERQVRWPEEVLGLAAQEHLGSRFKVKPGDTFRFRRYEPVYNTVLTVEAQVREPELVSVSPGLKNDSKQTQKLLRVNLIPDPLIAPGQRVQPPSSVWWLNEELVPVRRQQELEGLGAIVFTRATKLEALAPLPRVDLTDVGKGVPDVGLTSLIPLTRAIVRPHQQRAILYRITIRGERDVGSALVSDSHQQVRKFEGESLELMVRPVLVTEPKPTPPSANATPPGPECLSSSHYLDHAHPAIRDLVRRQSFQAEGLDALNKALRIERWVKGALRPDNTQDLEPASVVARRLRGDCRSAAILTAALCRATGIPSRTAHGLVYVDRGKPSLGFHMWTEVWLRDRWVGLDSTLGLGRVGPTHIKINHHDWHDVASLIPLLPVSRVLGRLSVEVLRVE